MAEEPDDFYSINESFKNGSKSPIEQDEDEFIDNLDLRNPKFKSVVDVPI